MGILYYAIMMKVVIFNSANGLVYLNSNFKLYSLTQAAAPMRVQLFLAQVANLKSHIYEVYGSTKSSWAAFRISLSLSPYVSTFPPYGSLHEIFLSLS